MMTHTGVVLRFGNKGYGWIQLEGTRTPLFFHVNDVVGRKIVTAGDRVEFQIQPNGPKGDRALLVTLLSEPSNSEVHR